jgi:hypothetical protein
MLLKGSFTIFMADLELHNHISMVYNGIQHTIDQTNLLLVLMDSWTGTNVFAMKISSLDQICQTLLQHKDILL